MLLSTPLMVMAGIALMAVAFMFYCFWNRYSGFWRVVFIFCSFYSWILGMFTEMAGLIVVWHPGFSKKLSAWNFEAFLAVSTAVIVVLWWLPWFGKNWRKVYKSAKKSGYI